jgi:hypothetical protein
MKKILLLLFLGLFNLSINAQKVGKSLDITNNFTHSYMEVRFNPNQGYITIYWGDQYGNLRNEELKNLRFKSFAALFEYLESFGWIYYEKFPLIGPDNNFRLVFKREKKSSI